jgi:hypothetical protein
MTDLDKFINQFDVHVDGKISNCQASKTLKTNMEYK